MTMKDGKVTVKVPGTCGELVQGIFDGSVVHITCPVNIYSYVTVELNNSGKIKCPDNKWKSRLALEKIFELYRCVGLGGTINIKSEIPAGKGMASSTADIIGVCLGTAALLGKEISEYEISTIAASIEPSDGTMFKGINLFDHREGKLIKHFGEPPPINILVIDFGGCIDTVEFNQNDFSEKHLANCNKIRNAIELVHNGIKQNNMQLIGKGATISAMCNQDILFKPHLSKIIDIAMNMDAVGVNVAHSGTVAGVIFNKSFNKSGIFKNIIWREINGDYMFYDTQLVGGGGEIIE